MLTLISHIRNEALLLPQWIAHHRPMVDAATIIDYASTDESLDIVRTLAPDWRIVRITGDALATLASPAAH